jgi:2-polyprenyl-3-methyl-5-hydroxy-6-metoxy-1,4-benzoquinol methylase
MSPIEHAAAEALPAPVRITPGKVARKLLRGRFGPVARLYRSIFVDLERVAAALDPLLPPYARCLDIGGGDGMLADILLRRRPDISITLIDLAPDVGDLVDPSRRSRIELHPATSTAQALGWGRSFDVVTVCDVLHHVPVAMRPGLLQEVAELCRSSGAGRLIIKDVEPGHLRSVLSLLSDWYVTGDRHVELIRSRDVLAAVTRAQGEAHIAQATIVVPDAPNYCVAISLAMPGA